MTIWVSGDCPTAGTSVSAKADVDEPVDVVVIGLHDNGEVIVVGDLAAVRAHHGRRDTCDVETDL